MTVRTSLTGTPPWRVTVLEIRTAPHAQMFPDSFNFTVPIWCAVINAVLCLGDGAVHLPPWAPRAYAHRISECVSGWVAGLGCTADLIRDSLSACLHSPLIPVWTSPDTDGLVFPSAIPPASELPLLGFTAVVCVSASRDLCTKQLAHLRETQRLDATACPHSSAAGLTGYLS